MIPVTIKAIANKGTKALKNPKNLPLLRLAIEGINKIIRNIANKEPTRITPTLSGRKIPKIKEVEVRMMLLINKGPLTEAFFLTKHR